MNKFYAFAMAVALCTAALPVCVMPVTAAEVLEEEEQTEAPEFITTGTITGDSFYDIYDAKANSSFKMDGRTYTRGITYGHSGQGDKIHSTETKFDVTDINKISFHIGHVDNSGISSGMIRFQLDGIDAEQFDLTANSMTQYVELDVSGAKTLTIVSTVNGGGQYAIGDVKADDSEIALPASAPTYDSPTKMLGAAYNAAYATVFSKGDKSESFQMQGRTFYQGIRFSSVYKAGTTDVVSQITFNTENAKKLKFTIGHIDDTQMKDATLKIYRDNVCDENDTIELTAYQNLKEIEIDVTDTKCLRIECEHYYGVTYGLGDFSLDGKADENLSAASAAGKPEQLLNAAINKNSVTLYKGADKSTSFKCKGRTYYQGIVFENGKLDNTTKLCASEMMLNVENYKELKFSAAHIDNTVLGSATVKIYLDNELADDNIITIEGTQFPKEYTVDVADASLVRIVAEYPEDSRFALCNLAADGQAAAIDCTVPTYSTSENFVASAYDLSNMTAYSLGDKSKSFNMDGRTFYEGIICKYSSNGNADSVSKFTVNTENVKKFGYTVCHVDGSKMFNGKVKVYLDGVYSEADSYDVNPWMLWENREINTENCSTVRFEIEREKNAGYGFADFVVDGVKAAIDFQVPTYSSASQLLNAGFASQNAAVIDSFSMGGENFDQGVQLRGSIFNDTNYDFICYNVENCMTVDFTFGAISGKHFYSDDHFFRVVVDGKEVERIDNITPQTANQHFSINVGSASVMRIDVVCSADDAYGIGNLSFVEKPEYLKGDANSDWNITIEDAQLTLNAYVELMAGKESGLNELETKAADVNEDGTISVEDAQFILQYYLENSVGMKKTEWSEILGLADEKTDAADEAKIETK